MSESSALKGVISGKTIELDREPGLPDGQEVTVTLVPASAQRRAFLSEENQRRWEEAMEEVKDLTPEEAQRRSAGAWAEDAEELDEFLEWNRQQRKLGRRELDP